MPKRDIYEGALPQREYNAQVLAKDKPKKSFYLDSHNSMTLKVPKTERRNVDEKVVQKEIKELIKKRGGWVVKYYPTNIIKGKEKNTGALGNTERGVPDLIACYKGYFIGIEVKTPKASSSTVSGEQLAQARAVVRAGGRVLFVYSVVPVLELLAEIDFLEGAPLQAAPPLES